MHVATVLRCARQIESKQGNEEELYHATCNSHFDQLCSVVGASNGSIAEQGPVVRLDRGY